MALGATTANELGLLIFNGTAMADIAQNDSSSPATSYVLSLHTADPGASGTAATSVANYTGYANLTLDRDSSDFTMTANVLTNAAIQTFGACTAGSNTITHFMLSKTGGQQLIRGALTAPLAVSAGITPSFAIGEMEATFVTSI
jgi:hypothetical protein